ncbi:MAG: lysophospholipid acyltransferase family protein [Alphaproteobacteria bacterium]
MLGWIRLIFVLVVATVALLVMAPVHLLVLAVRRRSTSMVAVRWHRLVLALMGVRVIVSGQISAERPLLLLSNHMSWLDIEILASLAPLSFIAKSEVANWPVFGLLARLQHTIFVERERRTRTGEKTDEVARRLVGGDIVVLFAEGTSSDGNHVLPFRSALVGAAQKAIGANGAATIQPVAIAYVRTHGIPLGRRHRAQVAWYGDTDLLPHLKLVLMRGGIDVHVTFGPPQVIGPADNRKAIAAQSGAVVRRLVSGLNTGRDADALLNAEMAIGPDAKLR